MGLNFARNTSAALTFDIDRVPAAVCVLLLIFRSSNVQRLGTRPTMRLTLSLSFVAVV